MMVQGTLPEEEPQHPKRIIGIYRFAQCHGSCGKTCHTYRGNSLWTCDVCGARRRERVWVQRPQLKRLQS